ncbi:lipocalin family protein [Dysgonomonas sp. ZJ279]|uniref:lipocalin family protein n=1 Tax=Dysgonomonas sp. ZJ279 TaxID=2709796 RepID=UPI0013EACBE5|nr:lipocalin family protein [Dysgonomonas sp. ZJ279]
MKQIKFISAILLLATLFLGFNACSSDDDKDEEQTNSIVGKWKLTTNNGSIHTHLEFKSDGTFEYTSTKETDYKEVGKYKIESDKLYQMFSDEEDWVTSQIVELNTISLILQEFHNDGTLSNTKDSYQRIN